MSTLTEREHAVLQAMISFFRDHPGGGGLPLSQDLAPYLGGLTKEEITEAGDRLESRGYVSLDRSAFQGWAVIEVTWLGEVAAEEYEE